MYITSLLFFCLYFSYYDITKRKISNNSVLIFIIFQLFCGILSKELNLISASTVLFIGFLFFIFRLVSGGDIKLAVSFSLLLDMHSVYFAVVFMFLFGGVQSFYYLLKHIIQVKLNGESNVSVLGVPYGVAICIGFFLATLIESNPTT